MKFLVCAKDVQAFVYSQIAYLNSKVDDTFIASDDPTMNVINIVKNTQHQY